MKTPRFALMLVGLTACLFGLNSCSSIGHVFPFDSWAQDARTNAVPEHQVEQSVSPESDRVYQQNLDKLKVFAAHGGATATDCGQIARPAKSNEAAKCGINAFSKQESFYLLYYDTFGARFMSHGVAGDGDGNVIEIGYDSKGWLQIGFPKRSQFSDDGRIVSTLCIKPISLVQTDNSELACAIPLSPRASIMQIPAKPLDTTICEIEKDPSAFNNKLVRVRGSVLIGSEYSTIGGEACPYDGLWFELGGGGSPPGLVATIAGGSRPGAEDADGRIVPPFAITLVRDANFAKFDRLIRAAIKADKQTAKSDEYIFHKVTATFVGRIDGVSPEIHAFHLKRKPMDKLDYLGFGQAGQFDAQLVVRSVENDAVMSVIHDRN
jgi:hypothetical protein